MGDNSKITLEDAMGLIIRNLGEISFPASILATMSPEQILSVKQNIIDPIETARFNMIEIQKAYVAAVSGAKANAEVK